MAIVVDTRRKVPFGISLTIVTATVSLADLQKEINYRNKNMI